MNIMNYNRILRALNFLFVCCGYQAQWFNLEERSCKLNLASGVYLMILALWYAACFRQHFLESSIFLFLESMVPILHQIIRLHLLVGLKIWILLIIDMKHITKTLNELIKTLPPQTHFSWSWDDIKAYSCLFSGLLLNLGFALYIMFELNFRLPTLNQIMHGSALFLPHFALACSFKMLNVTSMFSRAELQDIHTKITKSTREKQLESIETDGQNSVELLTTAQTNDNAVQIPDLETLQILVKRLEKLVEATNGIQQIIQKQIIFLFVMNTISLLGASYSIVYYETAWYLILDESIGNCLLAFNVGVFVFIFWDLFSLCIVNFILRKKKSDFLKDILKVLKNKPPLAEDKRLVFKQIKQLLKYNFNMKIFYNVPIDWQSMITVNALVGLGISVFMVFRYLDDSIENLETQISADED